METMTETRTRFYVVEHEYVGPNRDDHTDDRYVVITTTAPRTNLSGEIRTEGWLGTTNDWSATAHGEFETEAEARQAVEAMLGEYRETDAENADDVAAYKPGRSERLTAEETLGWTGGMERDGITADTTDEEIEQAVAECMALGYQEGIELHEETLRDSITDYRDDLRADAED